MLIFIVSLAGFLAPDESIRFQIPWITLSVILVVGLAIKIWRPMTEAATPELSSLFRLCQNDFHLETIIDRGITIPVEIVATLAHIFDKYILQWFLTTLPTEVTREINESSHLIDQHESPGRQTGLILTATIILIAVVLLKR